MHKIMLAAIAATFTAATTAPLMAAEAPKKASGKVVMTPAGDIPWKDVEGFPGVKMAGVQGDPGKGANHSMMRLPAGFSAPLHHHTPDHYVAVITGTLVLTVDGKETKLPPGSYFQFTGKKPHLTRCDAGADCTLFVDSRAKWDIVPEGGKPAAKK